MKRLQDILGVKDIMTQDNGCVDVAIYLRLSREKSNIGENEDSLINHREELVRLAENNNYNYTIYEEIASSMDAQREQYNKMLRNVRAGLHCKILVMDEDRLTRSLEEKLRLYKELGRLNTLIQTPRDIIDPMDSNQKIMTVMKGLFSEMEYESISKRQIEVKLQIAKRGGYSGKVPLGYGKDKATKKLYIIEDEAKIVTEVFDLFLQGYSTQAIAIHLNKKGYKTKEGNMFRSNAIHRILNQRAYLGESHYTSHKLGETVTMQDTHEPIVSYEQFAKVQDMLQDKNKGSHVRYRDELRSPLQKLVKCSSCGSILNVQPSWGRDKEGIKTKPYLHLRGCKNYRGEFLDTPCGTKGYTLRKMMPDVLEKIQQHKEELQHDLQESLSLNSSGYKEKLQKRQAEIKSEIAKKRNLDRKLLDYLLDEDVPLTKAEYTVKKNEISEQVSALSVEAEDIERQIQNLDTNAHTKRIQELILLIEQFEYMDIDAQHRLLKTLLSSIEMTFTKEMKKPIFVYNWRL
jgi:site-specific DNA recombinase